MARWSWLVLTVFVVLAVNAQDPSAVTSQAKEVSPSDQAKVTSSTSGIPEEEKKNVTSTTQTADPTTTLKTTSTETTSATTTPSTTTTTPLTTTTSTSTTTASTSTTTASTSTTTSTSTIPTTTPAAGPVPSNETWPNNVGNWSIVNANNVPCLRLDAAFKINLNYNQDNATKLVAVLVPTNAKMSGDCNTDNIVQASLSWLVSTPTNLTVKNLLSLTFGKQNSTDGKGSYTLNAIVLSVLNNQTNSTVSPPKANVTLFETPLERSYKCSKDTSIKIANDVELVVTSLQFQAFSASNSSDFSKVLECSSDDVSAVVPFAVGASLALLVVIVLIAYLIGRRRSRARGYQSV